MAGYTPGVIRGRISRGLKTDGSGYSNYSCALMSLPPDGPNAPSNVTATASLSTILLKWSAPTKNSDGTDLGSGYINGYWVYVKDGSSPTKESYDDRVWVMATALPWSAPTTNTYYFGVTTENNSGQESSLSDIVSSYVNFTGGYGNDPINPVGGLHISDYYIGYFREPVGDEEEGEWVSYIANDGSFYLRGFSDGVWGSAFVQWLPGSTLVDATLIVLGTYKSSVSGEDRIEIHGAGASKGWAFAIDESDKERVGIHSDGISVWDSGGMSTLYRNVYIPTDPDESVVIKNAFSVFHNQVVVGRSSEPSTTADLYVEGAARLGGGSTAESLVLGDYPGENSAVAINAIISNGNPPDASSVPEGTIFLRYA
jgi:hypothetical protein